MLLFAVFALPARAVVNMESLHLQEPADGFTGEIEVSASGASGNTDKSSLAAGTRLQWHAGRQTSFLVLNHASGETSGVRDTYRSFAHARHIVQVRPRWAGELFAQGEEDEFARLAFRGLIGGGVRYALLQRAAQSAAFLGVGAFHQSETLTATAGTTDRGTERSWRGNFYLVLKHHFSETVRVISSTYYQPDVASAGDFRLLENAALDVALTDSLALRVGLEVRHDSRPPETVEETDVTYRTGLNLTF